MPRSARAMVVLSATLAVVLAGWGAPARAGAQGATGVVGPSAPAAQTTPRPSASGGADPRALAALDTQPVVLTGAQFPDWSAGPEVTARAPQAPTDYSVADTQGATPAPLRSDCYQASPGPDVNGWTDPNHGDHNCYQSSQLPIRTAPGRTGIALSSLRGFRYDGQRFVQIPFQVDSKWVHYISNNASGFAVYSGADQELTYTFDREGFRYTTNKPFDPADPQVVCRAEPIGGAPATADPNAGLIDTDKMAFMARDGGQQAPSTARLPQGIAQARQVRLTDPATGVTRYVYVMRSAPSPHGGWAVPSAYAAANSPYVHYRRDPGADTFVFSQSSYSDYGNAPKGPVCTPDGRPVIRQGFKRLANGQLALDPTTFVQRRPVDTATVTTPRYRFRFGGRWVMGDLRVSGTGDGLTRHDFGPSIIDRFKGRAFQQSPGGSTPCCGYEDEQNNWGGSSQLMGERWGPVRAIRVTWGADSGTNVVRTDVLYPYSIDHVYELRVHPIPPLDGIYTQWDMAAGRVTTYYNPYNPQGVPVEGINPVLYGDTNAHLGPDGVSYSSNDRVGRTLESAAGRPVAAGNPNDTTCTSSACVYGSFNLPDATFSGLASEVLSWEEMTGRAGTMVEKWGAHQVTPVGSPLATVEAVPYYVDDACFDDGTGNDPGPHVATRSANEPMTWGYDAHGVAMSPAPPGSVAHQRRCWNHHADGTPYNIPGTATYRPSVAAERADPPPDPSFSPQGDVRYLQGDVATHGLHLLFNTESDNAGSTVPVDEVDAVDHQVILAGNQPDVGAVYSQQFVTPAVAVVTPWPASTSAAPGATAAAPSPSALGVSGALASPGVPDSLGASPWAPDAPGSTDLAPPPGGSPGSGPASPGAPPGPGPSPPTPGAPSTPGVPPAPVVPPPPATPVAGAPAGSLAGRSGPAP